MSRPPPLLRNRLQLSTAAIVSKIGHELSVLVAVRHDQVRGVLGIALLGDQRHDGVGGDRIEAGGRRIVQHQRRLGHHRARDSHAPAHAAREFARELLQRLLQLDEPQCVLDALDPPPRRDTVCLAIHQRIGDVLRHGDGIEQTAFLKQHAHPAANIEQVALRSYAVMSLAEQDTRWPESGLIRPSAVFSSMVFPLPAAPSITRVSPAIISKDMSSSATSLVETHCDVFETQKHSRRAVGRRGPVRSAADSRKSASAAT